MRMAARPPIRYLVAGWISATRHRAGREEQGDARRTAHKPSDGAAQLTALCERRALQREVCRMRAEIAYANAGGARQTTFSAGV